MKHQTQHDRDRDTGKALALLLLILQVATRREGYVVAAGLVLVVTMAVPVLLRPAAIAWFALSHAIGAVMSRVVMTIVFFLVVTPMAVVRRMLGKDSMRLREFGRGSGSVMVNRDHRVSAADLVHPY